MLRHLILASILCLLFAPSGGAGGLVLTDGELVFPDGTTQGAAGGRRGFYLTPGQFAGSNALGACDPGFHMASLFELGDLGGLAYDTGRGFTLADAGKGPPRALGWLRTGKMGSTSDDAGTANCNAWTTSSSTSFGTRAVPSPQDGPGVAPGTFWALSAVGCNTLQRVWCIAD